MEFDSYSHRVFVWLIPTIIHSSSCSLSRSSLTGLCCLLASFALTLVLVLVPRSPSHEPASWEHHPQRGQINWRADNSSLLSFDGGVVEQRAKGLYGQPPLALDDGDTMMMMHASLNCHGQPCTIDWNVYVILPCCLLASSACCLTMVVLLYGSSAITGRTRINRRHAAAFHSMHNKLGL